jgi:hypothetical protein
MPVMSLTLDQRTNIDGVPKAAELIEISGGYALEASDRAIMNMLYQHAHDSGRLADPTASWELPITTLRPSKHNGTDRIRDSLSRLLSVQVKVAYRDGKTGRDRILLTHLFESFDIPADDGIGGPQGFGSPGDLPMRSMLLAGFVALTAIAAVAPAHAQATGGIVITHGGGNTNVASGRLSQADQSATTLGGTAGRRGVAITNGGGNRNVASGALSFAGQDTTTIGGTALGRGRVITNGGQNNNFARGFGSSATQSTLTSGGTAFGRGTSITNGGVNTNLAAGRFSSADQQVVTLGGTAGRHGLNVTSGGANTNKALGFGSSASQQVFTGAQ